MHDALQTIPLLSPADYQNTGSDLDSINTGLLHKVRILLAFGAITGDGALVQLYAGATAGAKTTELPFSYRLSGADMGNASADVFGAVTDVAVGGLTLVGAATDLRVIQIDVMSAALPEGKPYLTVAVDDGAASVLFMSAIAIGWPRYEQLSGPTVL